ncbi:DUF2141 domain-containing protein [Alkalinema pantanalense CENA528]|uniref:DUF2141 domain-containing protein n=1 Tax=Alkalinema pantanalense TaxID=1620705 RepID=UPI003D6E36F3
MKKSPVCTIALSVGTLLLPFCTVVPASYAQRINAVQANSELVVEIDGLKNQKGQVCLSLFSSSKGFPSNGNQAIRSQCAKITNDTPRISFNNLRAGSYAVAVLHDANSDNQLNRNAFGIPTEGFGFSRNPAIRAGAPKFSEAAVVVAGPNTSLQVQMKYLFGN